MKTCQYCKVAKTDKFIRTATGRRWKCETCQKKRYKPWETYNREKALA